MTRRAHGRWFPKAVRAFVVEKKFFRLTYSMSVAPTPPSGGEIVGDTVFSFDEKTQCHVGPHPAVAADEARQSRNDDP